MSFYKHNKFQSNSIKKTHADSSRTSGYQRAAAGGKGAGIFAWKTRGDRAGTGHPKRLSLQQEDQQ